MMKKLLIRPLSRPHTLQSSSSSSTTRLFSSPPPPLSSIFEISPKSTAETEEEKAKKKEEEGGFKPLYRRLSSLGGAPAGSVFRTMDKWVSEGKPAKSAELIKYVKDLRKYRRYKHALELMDWMVGVRGMNTSQTIRAIRIDLISKVYGIKFAEDCFSYLPESAKKEKIYAALFNCYCSEKMIDKATSLYRKMNKLNFVSNTLVQNSLMRLYMKLEQPEKVPPLLQEMKANNVARDTLTYCIVMRSYAALNDIDSVERVIHEMEEDEKVTVHWNAYSTLAAIYNSAGHFNRAKSSLKKLEELIDCREREPFHFLISLYAGAGNLEEVKRVWQSLKSTFVKRTNRSYLTMLQALNKLDDVEGLRHCYDEWELIYVTYDPRLTNVLFSGYLRKDMIEEAESLYAKIKEKEGDLNFRTCDLFMDYYLKKNETGLALKWLDIATQMVRGEEWKLDQEKVSLFLKHYEKAKDMNGVEKFCMILKKLKCLGPKEYKLIKDGEIELNPQTQKLLDEVCASK